MTGRLLVLARASKPLHQTRSLHEVVLASGRARRHDPDLPLLAVGCRVGRAGATAQAARHAQGWSATQAPAAGHRRRDRLPGAHRLRLAAAAAPVPTSGTVDWWFAKWAADGPLQQLHEVLRERVRVQAGRAPTPTAAIIDSQSVRAADTVGKASRGWDAGKKVNGRKRHLAVDTMGLLLVVWVTAASVQDRHAARPLLWRLRAGYRGIRLVWADAGYAGKLVAWRPPCCTWGGDRAEAPWPVGLPGAAAPLGRGADLGVDQQAPPHRPRLRATARPSRRDGHLGHDRRDDPTPGTFPSTTIHPDQHRITVLRHSLRPRPLIAGVARELVAFTCTPSKRVARSGNRASVPVPQATSRPDERL
jgi:transposase